MFRREILSWALLGLALGLVEAATAAVLVKQHYGPWMLKALSGVIPPPPLPWPP